MFFLTDGETSAPGSFMFSLLNNDGLAPFKSPLKDDNDTRAIARDNRFGPTFGGGRDLYIHDNAGLNTDSFTHFGYTYDLPPGYIRSKTNTLSLLAGNQSFSPSELEVLYIN